MAMPAVLPESFGYSLYAIPSTVPPLNVPLSVQETSFGYASQLAVPHVASVVPTSEHFSESGVLALMSSTELCASRSSLATWCPTIHEVWASNFDKEFECMLGVAGKCCYVAFDVEYPGCLQSPRGWVGRGASSDEIYSTLRGNVDALKPIQLGLAFAGEDRKPLGCWQFNFHFDACVDRFEPGSLDFLATAGLDFSRHMAEGLSMISFAERFTSAGLAFGLAHHWISFHGMYDFAYLLKMLTGDVMPPTLSAFDEALDTFFPRRLDIKWQLPRGSLSRLAREFGLERRGTAHHAGSDALLTLELCLRMEKERRGFIASSADGRLFGLHAVSGEGNEALVKSSKGGRTNAEQHQRILTAQQAAVRQRPSAKDAVLGTSKDEIVDQQQQIRVAQQAAMRQRPCNVAMVSTAKDENTDLRRILEAQRAAALQRHSSEEFVRFSECPWTTEHVTRESFTSELTRHPLADWHSTLNPCAPDFQLVQVQGHAWA